MVDRLGRLVGLAERVQRDTVTYTYGYDAAGRLAEARTGAVVTATCTHDANGNRNPCGDPEPCRRSGVRRAAPASDCRECTDRC